MTGLTEGADYYIRVIAVNDAGPGAPGVTEPATVKEPQGVDSFIIGQDGRNGQQDAILPECSLFGIVFGIWFL